MVQQLSVWIDSRDDVSGSIVCGDFKVSLNTLPPH
jgi:hypothetical protein